MSTETPTLSDHVAESDPEPPQWLNTEPDGPCCEGCGAPLTRFASLQQVREVVRVLGVDGSVPACPECVPARPGATVQTITMAVTFARQRRD